MSREEKHIWKAWRRMKYNINPESGIPIYRQLADIIFAEIKSGSIKSGSKLPTVRELAKEAGVARGTVKRAYEELRRDGAVEMTQGRGTFAKYAPESGKSRKDRAMDAIDKMLDTLRELELSPSEAQIFVELRLREYARRGDRARVALVECTPEILGQIAESLREIGGAEVRSFLLSDILSYPYKLSDDADIILTTQNHAAELEKALPEEKKLMRAALALRPESVREIAALPPNAAVGIVCKSPRFGALMAAALKNYSRAESRAQPFVLGGELSEYLRGKTAVLLPENYENFCSPKEAKELSAFGEAETLIKCGYRADNGTLIALEERIKAVKEEKKL